MNDISIPKRQVTRVSQLLKPIAWLVVAAVVTTTSAAQGPSRQERAAAIKESVAAAKNIKVRITNSGYKKTSE